MLRDGPTRRERRERDENAANETNNSEPQFLKSAPNMTRSPERRPSDMDQSQLCSSALLADATDAPS